MNVKVMPLSKTLMNMSKPDYHFHDKIIREKEQHSTRHPVVFQRPGTYLRGDDCWQEFWDGTDQVWRSYGYSAKQFRAELEWNDVWWRFNQRQIDLLDKCQNERLLSGELSRKLQAWHTAKMLHESSRRSKYRMRKRLNEIRIREGRPN